MSAVVSSNLRPVIIVLGLLLLVGPTFPPPEGAHGQSGSCSGAFPPGSEPAVLGGERVVWSFDSGTDIGNGFAPSYTDPELANIGDAVGTQPNSYASETLYMGQAFRVTNGPLRMPDAFRDDLDGGEKRSLVLLFSYVKSSGVHQTLIDASPASSDDGGFRVWEDIGNRVVIDIKSNGQRIQGFIHDYLAAGTCNPHLLVLTYDHERGHTDIYVDGTRVSRITNSEALWGTSGDVMLGAARAGDQNWQGRIDELRLLDRPVSLAEQRALLEGTYCESDSAACPDVYPPGTLHVLSGRPNGMWYRDDVTISLSAADAAVGLDRIEYNLTKDDGTWTAGTYTGPLRVNESRAYTLTYNATDLAGNAAPERSVTFGLDKTFPTDATWLEPQPGQDCIADFPCSRTRADGLTLIAAKSSQRVEIDAIDPESGIQSVAFYLNGRLIGLDFAAPYVAVAPEPGPFNKLFGNGDEPATMLLEASIQNHAGLRTVLVQEVAWA